LYFSGSLCTRPLANAVDKCKIHSTITARTARPGFQGCKGAIIDSRQFSWCVTHPIIPAAGTPLTQPRIFSQVLVNNKKFAWYASLSSPPIRTLTAPYSESCIKGHRSSACQHTSRPLYQIKNKGRPVSQCDKCRKLRQAKRVHAKCTCNVDGDTSNAADLLAAAAGTTTTTTTTTSGKKRAWTVSCTCSPPAAVLTPR
jgi:hypothetical protein